MQSHLLEQASRVIEVPQILINVISRRVRQLHYGHRPLILVPPGLGHSDVALMEVIAGKLSYNLTATFTPEPTLAQFTVPGEPEPLPKVA